MKIILKVEW